MEPAATRGHRRPSSDSGRRSPIRASLLRYRQHRRMTRLMTTPNRQRPILFAYDRSEQAKAAIREAAAQLAAVQSSAFAHGVEPQPSAAHPFAPGVGLPSDLEERLEQEAMKKAEKGAALVRSVGLTPPRSWRGAFRYGSGSGRSRRQRHRDGVARTHRPRARCWAAWQRRCPAMVIVPS